MSNICSLQHFATCKTISSSDLNIHQTNLPYKTISRSGHNIH